MTFVYQHPEYWKVIEGEISEEEKKYLLEKAMFSYYDKGKELYRYKLSEGVTDQKGASPSFFEPSSGRVNAVCHLIDGETSKRFFYMKKCIIIMYYIMNRVS
jgi:hypothetical protein